IYDVWLTGCKANSEVPAPPGVETVAKPAPEPEKPAEAAAPATAPQDPAQAGTDPSLATVPGDDPNQAALPPLDAPVDVPDDVYGGTEPPAEFPLDGNPVP
ncbi:MAG: DUF2155 domain-containing protein, partial [Alphaproteobacteria bacterium]|nr:DUF2155 domain-containing protein [Alphaproteobacteria bacterium]